MKTIVSYVNENTREIVSQIYGDNPFSREVCGREIEALTNMHERVSAHGFEHIDWHLAAIEKWERETGYPLRGTAAKEVEGWLVSRTVRRITLEDACQILNPFPPSK